MSRSWRPLSDSPGSLLSPGAKYEYYINVYLKNTALCRIPFVSGEDEKNLPHRGELLISVSQSGLTSLPGIIPGERLRK